MDVNPTRVYANPPTQVYVNPTQVYINPTRVYVNPTRVYANPPTQVYANPTQVYINPTRLYANPTRVYGNPTQAAAPAAEAPVTPARGKTPPGGKTPPAGGKTPPRGKTPPAGGKGAAVVEAGAAEADAWEEEVSSPRCTTSFTWVGNHISLTWLFSDLLYSRTPLLLAQRAGGMAACPPA